MPAWKYVIKSIICAGLGVIFRSEKILDLTTLRVTYVMKSGSKRKFKLQYFLQNFLCRSKAKKIFIHYGAHHIVVFRPAGRYLVSVMYVCNFWQLLANHWPTVHMPLTAAAAAMCVLTKSNTVTQRYIKLVFAVACVYNNERVSLKQIRLKI